MGRAAGCGCEVRSVPCCGGWEPVFRPQLAPSRCQGHTDTQPSTPSGPTCAPVLADTHCASHVAPSEIQDPPPGCSPLGYQSDTLECSQQACHSPLTGSHPWAKAGSLPIVEVVRIQE